MQCHLKCGEEIWYMYYTFELLTAIPQNKINILVTFLFGLFIYTYSYIFIKLPFLIHIQLCHICHDAYFTLSLNHFFLTYYTLVIFLWSSFKTVVLGNFVKQNLSHLPLRRVAVRSKAWSKCSLHIMKSCCASLKLD